MRDRQVEIVRTILAAKVDSLKETALDALADEIVDEINDLATTLFEEVIQTLQDKVREEKSSHLH
jgi:hypothetical protein